MQQNQADENNKPKYAGFGMRMLASVIDSFLSIVILLPFVTIFNKVYSSGEVQRLIDSGALKLENVSQEQMVEFITRQLTAFTFQNILLAVAVVLFWVYRSATPGKIILKMKIVDARTGGHPSKKQLIIRYLGYFIALLPCALGFIWIYYDKKKQGWHDKIAGTVVVYDKKSDN